MTNPEALRLARSIVKEHYPEMKDSYTGRRLQIAIAAIERTKDLSVQFLRTDDGLETIAAFERYDHLRQSEKDNSDAE